MKKIISTIFAIIFVVNTFAQTKKCTISGYIRDAVSGETLIGAGVTMISAAKATGAVTNEYGVLYADYPRRKSEPCILICWVC